MSHAVIADLAEIKMSLIKPAAHRSYDELLLLKSMLSKTDFVKNIMGNALFPKQMDELCRNLVLETFHAGDIIIKQGDLGDRMFIVLSGVCEVRMRQVVELAHGLSETREKALFQCTANMNFGEKALQTDAPRGASVVAIEHAECISIHKFVYNNLIKSAIAEAESNAAKIDQPGTKGYTMKVLSKRPEFRTKIEIEAVAGYLEWRIPFFRRFTGDQRLELARVSQAVSIYGETVLFKQGSVGQAFYVVLTGSVEVWVATADEMAMNAALKRDVLANHTGAAGNKESADSQLKHGLGTKVALLAVGDTFGERALENEDSMRMASICTCETMTDLLVIAREDYHKLVSALLNTDLMKKIKILRSTEIFRNVDAVHLKELARYMEPKRFEVDDIVIKAGSKATEMIITEIGECMVEVPIATFSTSANTASKTATKGNTHDDDASSVDSAVAGDHKKHTSMEIGRLAPYSVLASYITQVQTLFEQVIHPETVTASTLVVGYTVGLYDFFSNLNRESRGIIAKLVKDYQGSLLPALWETQAKRVGDQEWRVKMAWDKYRQAMKEPGNALTYLGALRSFSHLHLTVDSGNIFQNNSGAYKPRPEDIPAFYPTFAQETSVARTHTESSMESSTAEGPLSKGSVPPPKPVDMTWGIPKQKHKVTSVLKDLDYDVEAVHPVVQNALQAAKERERLRAIEAALASESAAGTTRQTNTKNSKEDHNSALSTSASDASLLLDRRKQKSKKEGSGFAEDTQRCAFTLLHIHKEKIAMNANSLGAQRKLKCFMRICGTQPSCTEAKKAADMLMQSVLLMQYNSDLSKSAKLALHWHSFSSFKSMPLRNSDIFLVFCRSVPVEYACICPEKDLMDMNFPAFCKVKNQFFAVCTMRGLAPPEVPLPEVTEKRLRRRRKPKQTGIYGIEYDDTDDEGSDDEQVKIEREHAIIAAGMPAASSYKEAQLQMQLTEPVFLQELGSFAETLCTSTTLKGGLLYGKFVQSQMAHLDNITATYDPKIAEAAMTATGIGLRSAKSTITLPPASTMGTSQSSGAVKMTAEDKRICIFPLYTWLPVTEEILQENDITCLCNSENLELESRGADVGDQPAWSNTGFGLAPTSPDKAAATGSSSEPDNIKTAFTEAGILIASSSQAKVMQGSKSLSELPYLNDVVRQVAVKGLNKSINYQLAKDMEEKNLAAEQAWQEARLKRIQDLRPENRPTARGVRVKEIKVQSGHIQDTEGDVDLSFIATKEKTQSLSEVLSSRRRMIALNDKLCYEEGLLKPSNRKKAAARAARLADADGAALSDEGDEDIIGDFTVLAKPQKHDDSVGSDGAYQANVRSIDSYKRGVTLVATQQPGNFGPGGMGMLKQRMQMYDSLNGLPSSRKQVEKSLLRKKKEAEELAARKAARALPPPERVGKDKKDGSYETSLPQTISVLKNIMDKTISA